MKSIHLQGLENYNCSILEPIKILPTEILRDKLTLYSGNVIYGDKRLGQSKIEFSIEFKGTKEEIQENKSKFASDFELCRFTFKDRIYEGAFFIDSIESIYKGYEIVNVIGNCDVYKNLSVTKQLSNNGYLNIDFNDNVSTPLIVIIQGNGNNININCDAFKITIPTLQGTITINAIDKTILKNNENAFNLVQMIEFPETRFKSRLQIRVHGSGTYTTTVKYKERVI